MAAFASTDVTVVVVERKIIGGRRMVVGTMAFGNGALTYPTGGIPLPAIGAFGFVRNISDLNVSGLNGLTTDYLARYDKTNHKLSMFENAAAAGAFPECDAAEAPAARIYNFTAWGW